MQGLNTLEVKDSDLETSLVALDTALHDLDALPDVEAERAAAFAAREALQQRVAAQQALEDTMASVRGISKAEGVPLSSWMISIVPPRSAPDCSWPAAMLLIWALRPGRLPLTDSHHMERSHMFRRGAWVQSNATI